MFPPPAPTCVPPRPTAPIPDPDTDALGDRILEATIATMELAAVHLGLRLGLYHGLVELVEATSHQLAHHLALDERYVREWLEQQAVAQLLTCRDDAAPPRERIYAVPGATAAVLVVPDTPAYVGPLAHLAVGSVLPVEELEAAFRSGAGVPFSRYGAALRHGIGASNGATFDRELAGWLAELTDVDRRLRTSRDARILDIGCGTGRSTLALARIHPHAAVHGIDLDVASVEDARAATVAAGLDHRVTFGVADAAVAPPRDGRGYDLVTVLAALHDVGDPVGVLASARRQLRGGGAVFIADQRTRDAFASDGDPVERLQYGVSVLHCLPATRAEDHVVAHGTVLRAATVDAWARAAGFTGATVLPIDDPFWRLYRL